MTETRPHLEPGPDHPITVEPHSRKVQVTAGGATIAETDRALALREANYPAVLYIPIEDVNRSALADSDLHTYCPYKGKASYYDVKVDGGGDLAGAVWYYPDPYPAVSEIKGHIAFYANRVTIHET